MKYAVRQFSLSGALCLALVSTTVAAPTQWPVSQGGNGHSYQVMDYSGATWESAKAIAEGQYWQGRRGYLATITSAEENAFIYALLGGRASAWLGGYQDPRDSTPNENWHWVTGEPWLFSNWCAGEPNDFEGSYSEYYLQFTITSSCWNDDDAAVQTGTFVIEYDAPGAAEGSIVAWGSNDQGQYGVPYPNVGFTTIAAGYDHGLGLKTDGSVVVWGSISDVPVPDTGFSAVAGGNHYSLGLKTDGYIVVWPGGTEPSWNSGFTAIAAGGSHGMGLKADGSIVEWGAFGGVPGNVPWPNTGFAAVAAGHAHSLGLKADGSIVAWGVDTYGQCDVPSPNAGFTAIAAGMWHSLGLKADGSIVAWGISWDSLPVPNTGFVAIAAGGMHSLGLRADGSVVAWGLNDRGQCDVPAPNTGYLAIAAGTNYSLALKRAPSALAVVDIPDDQGGRVRVSWPAHSLDVAASPTPVLAYDIERFAAGWQALATVAAARADSYSVVVETLDILTVGQPVPYSRYRFVARTSDPLIFFASPPDSGYSVDNLPPSTPTLNLYDSETSRVLLWQNPAVPDFKETCVYRGTIPGFEATAPLLCSTGIYFSESRRGLYYYRARSFDIHGNASEWSNEVVGQYPTDVPSAPTALRLYPNQPNPFNPRTTLRFDLPEAGRVRLAVYDVRGKLIRELVDAELPAGSHSAVWDRKDSAGRAMASGGYFARLQAGGKVETVRMGLVR